MTFVLVPLAVLALFPIGWLGELYRPLGALLDGALNGVETHAVAHAGIFFLLGLALLLVAPALRRRPLLFFGLLLLAAVAQEGLQLLYKQRPIGFDEFRDLLTDVAGMAAAYALGRQGAGERRPAEGAARRAETEALAPCEPPLRSRSR